MDYEKHLNKNVVDLPKSGIRKFFDVASTMPDAISLGVGEPDFVTPWEYRAEAITSIKSGQTHYTPNRGMPKLLNQIAVYMRERFALDYEPQSEIMVTVGASQAIDLALRTLVTEGDEVLVPDPAYVSYRPNVTLAGGTAVGLNATEATDFKLTASAVESAITPRTRVIILPFPNNPTGAVLTREELEPICKVIIKHDLFVISDEIYAELTYGTRHVSPATLKGMRERTVVINGFSKAFAMTGWRLGFCAAPEPVLSQMLKIHQYVIMCAPTVSQYAAYSALSDGHNNGYAHVEAMRDEYDRRRKFLVGAFNDLGLTCFNPCGAFYAFPSVKAFSMTGEEFAVGLLNSERVAAVPGSAFGQTCDNYIRCTYAASIKVLTEALTRIERYIKSIKK